MNEEKLIEAVRKHELIYSKSTGSYKNIKKKAAAWVEIAAELNMDEKLCMTRWKRLRDRYCREMKRGQLPSGSASVNSCNWEYFENFSFLKDHTQPRTGRRNFELNESSESSTSKTFDFNDALNYEEDDIIIEDNLDNDENENESSQMLDYSTPQKQDKAENKFIETLNSFQTFLSKLKPVVQNIQSEEEGFMQGVLAMMKDFNPFNRAKAKAEIMGYLSKLQIQQLYGTTEDVIL